MVFLDKYLWFFAQSSFFKHLSEIYSQLGVIVLLASKVFLYIIGACTTQILLVKYIMYLEFVEISSIYFVLGLRFAVIVSSYFMQTMEFSKIFWDTKLTLKCINLSPPLHPFWDGEGVSYFYSCVCFRVYFLISCLWKVKYNSTDLYCTPNYFFWTW